MDSRSDRSEARHDPYAALRFQDFRLLLAGRFITSFGSEMLSFAISWELWLRTHQAFALGMVGLVQVAPVIMLSLPAGHVADQYNRKRIVFIAQSFLALCATGLALLSYTQGSIYLVYLCLLGIGIARAFNDPASSTLLPQTIPSNLYSGAATWNSSMWQIASITGPAIAGLAVALWNKVTWLYAFDAVAAITFIVLLSLIKGRPLPLARKAATLDSLTEGFKFMRDTKIILAAITLDMFAVLFGGAVALLPIYATDILKVGPQGLGVMRCAIHRRVDRRIFDRPPATHEECGQDFAPGCRGIRLRHDRLRTFELVLALGADACAVGRAR
jgi:MFS family permease